MFPLLKDLVLVLFNLLINKSKFNPSLYREGFFVYNLNMIFKLISRVFLPHPAFAQGTTWSNTCVSNGVATISGVECLFSNILQVIMVLAGLVFFAMFITGGFKYLTAGGDPKKTASAAHTITLSFISVLGVILAWLILLFIKQFTGVDVTQFTIKTN